MFFVFLLFFSSIDVRIFARRLFQAVNAKKLYQLSATASTFSRLLEILVEQVNANRSLTQHNVVVQLQQRLCDDITNQIEIKVCSLL